MCARASVSRVQTSDLDAAARHDKQVKPPIQTGIKHPVLVPGVRNKFELVQINPARQGDAEEETSRVLMRPIWRSYIPPLRFLPVSVTCYVALSSMLVTD